MRNSRWVAKSLCVVLILASGVIPPSARAKADGGAGRAERRVADSIAPIGAVESSGAILINGRTVAGKNVIWNGETLQASAEAGAVVTLEAIGQAQLKKGTTVRINTAYDAADSATRRILIASVWSGEADFKLQPGVAAYLEAGGSAWLAGAEANFHLSLRDGVASLNSVGGVVREIGSWALNLSPMARENGDSAAEPVSVMNWAVRFPETFHKTDFARAGTLEKPSERSADSTASLRRTLKLITGRGVPGSGKALSLYADPAARIIGVVESFGAMKINGRAARGQNLVWDGEMLQAPVDSPARVTLDGIGQVTLPPGSVAKLSTVARKIDDQTKQRFLNASVVNGEMKVKLLPEAGAYVEAAGESFAADSGAQFRLVAREDRAVMEPVKGVVQPIGSWIVELSPDLLRGVERSPARSRPRQYLIRPVMDGKLTGYMMKAKAQNTQTMQFLVSDGLGKPAPGVRVTFSLNRIDGKNAGSLGSGSQSGKVFEAISDASGIATLPFTSGDAGGVVSINASAQGADSAPAAAVNVTSSDDKFWTRKNAIPVLATAAAMIVAGVVIVATRDDKLPIEGKDPTIIVP